MESPDRIKVGISKTPSLRRTALASAANGLTLVYSASPGPKRARELEIKTHEILSDHRIKGEWFAVDAKTAVVAVIQAAEALGITLTKHEDEKLTLLIRLHDSTKESMREASLAEERSMAWLGEKLIIEGLRQRGYPREPKPKRAKK